MVAIDKSEYSITAAPAAVDLAQLWPVDEMHFVPVASLKPGQIGTGGNYPDCWVGTQRNMEETPRITANEKGSFFSVSLTERLRVTLCNYSLGGHIPSETL
mgnify:CR=1 FL=1